MSLERTLATLTLRYRWLLLALLAAGTAYFGWQFRHFNIANDPLKELADDVPDMQTLRHFEDKFGRIDLLVVALVDEDEGVPIFSTAGLETVAALTEKFQDLMGIESVVSLATVTALHNDDGLIETRLLLEPFADGSATPAELQRTALANPDWSGTVISADARTTALTLFLEDSFDDSEDRNRLVAQIRAILAADTPQGLRAELTGMAAVIADSAAYTESDVRQFFTLTPVVMFFLLFALFRRFTAVAIPNLLIVITIIWAIGLFFLLGNRINMATTLLPTLLALIALSDVVHALTHFYGLATPDKRERILLTMEHMIRACFMTSVTTAVGIGSLATSPVQSIHEFGFWAAIGILLAYFLVMTLVPIILSFLPPPRPGPHADPAPAKADSGGGKADWADRLDGFLQRRAWIVWVATGIVLVACTVQATRLHIETQVFTYLPTNAPAVEGLRVVDQNLAGSEAIEIMVSGEPGTFEQSWAIREIDALHAFVATLPRVNQIYSPAGIIRDLHRKLEPQDASSSGGLPEDDNDIAEYFFMLSASAWSDNLDALMADDYGTARVTARINAASTSQHIDYVERIEAYAREHLDPRLALDTTGRMKIFATHAHAVTVSMLRSLVYSFTIIAILLVLHFRSVKVALVSLLPNVIPVIVPLAIMGIAGVPLNAATATVACIAVGLAVDNDIHFLARYRRELAAGLDMDEALRVTLRHTGKAIIIVSIVIAGGFAIFLLSSFAPNRYFGFLIAIAMITAPLVDLFLLPLLIRITNLR